MVKLDMQIISKRFKELFGVTNMFMDRDASKEAGGYVFDDKAFIQYAMYEWGFGYDADFLQFIHHKFGFDAQRFIQFLINNREE